MGVQIIVLRCENLSKDFYELSEEEILYVKIKSKQRMIGRINARISKLNRYYNNPTELFARFFQFYCEDKEAAENFAPTATARFENLLNEKRRARIYLTRRFCFVTTASQIRRFCRLCISDILLFVKRIIYY